MSLTVNGLDVASMRWLASWSGTWVAELELRHGDLVMPSGRVAIASTEGIALVGRTDDEHTGTFGEKRRARVVGGLGWTKPVRAQHYHSDVGLALQVVASTTAAEAGEVVTVLLPKVIGTDFVRRAGPASQVFTDMGLDWWVGADGVTRVGKRLPAVPPTALEVKDWDPAAGTMSFTCPVLVEPGTILVDTRFGTRTVHAVEAMVSGGSVTGTLWVGDSAPGIGDAVNELVGSLEEIAREATRATYSRLYEYRVIAMAGDRVQLNAVERAKGIPDILPASVWAGISGYKATLTPASRVLVGFVAGDPSRPYVAAYEPPEADGWRPVILELDAVTTVALGGIAGALPIARAPAIVTFAQALKAAVTTAAGVGAGGAVPVTSAALGTLLTTLATAIETAGATLATNCPSTKVVSS